MPAASALSASSRCISRAISCRSAIIAPPSACELDAAVSAMARMAPSRAMTASASRSDCASTRPDRGEMRAIPPPNGRTPRPSTDGGGL
eukprot:scaffold23254_cov103-Isochrysis_galbana.AAC.2